MNLCHPGLWVSTVTSKGLVYRGCNPGWWSTFRLALSNLLFHMYSALLWGLSWWNVKLTTYIPVVANTLLSVFTAWHLFNLLILAGSITAAVTSTAQKRHFMRSWQYGFVYYSESNLQLTACQVSGINSLFLIHHNFQGSCFPRNILDFVFKLAWSPN
jgi:hypothetical protein